jgi:hypothetical protein
MTRTRTFLAAAAVAVVAPLLVAPAIGAPISGSTPDDSSVAQAVQYRSYDYYGGYRYDNGNYGYRYGDDAYSSYGYVAPRPRARRAVPPYRGYGERGYSFCSGDSEANTAYPNWMCSTR